uniref:peroxidase n=1 Tax=Strongyloides venezuelensis TaxID=75913 RepID=A0A0K0FH87_STRVS
MKNILNLIILILLLLEKISAQLSPPVTENFKCLSNGCCDQHEWCRFWASIGECQSNGDWMTINCQLACNTCKASKSNERISNKPSTSTNLPKDNGNCNAIKKNPSNAAEDLKKAGLINPVEDISSRIILSIDDITRSVPTGCVPQIASTDCRKALCYHLSYRTLDGTCNNLDNPLKGAAFKQYLRLLPPEYEGGSMGEPVDSITPKRPSARDACRLLLSSNQVVSHDSFNTLMMQFGQFLSHDMSKTTLQPTSQCKTCGPVPSKCIPIKISIKDPNENFKKKECLKMSRSAPVCGTGQTTPRQQLNENSGFIDGSAIYGSSSKDLHKFREGRTGFLKMTAFNSKMFLPFDTSKCISKQSCVASFVTGDIRGNLFVGLASIHILFAREHNRIARALQSLNPSWSGDRIFQEARKINGAILQHIVYTEYLPKLLGTSMENVVGKYNGYDPNVDPTISNVFVTAGFRFGHGMIQEIFKRVDENGKTIGDGALPFSDGVFKSAKILFEGGIDPILRGLMLQQVKRPHRMTPAITEKMFGSTDLGAVNINRGREHGMPSYNSWREFCGGKRATTFEEFSDHILDKHVRGGLAKAYKSPDDVDLYVGAMLEDPVVGGLIGSTLSCLVGNQFKRSRDGDRFYYENPGIFTNEQLNEIKKGSLSRIICDNSDGIQVITEDAFLVPKNGMKPCTKISSVDLSKWKD